MRKYFVFNDLGYGGELLAPDGDERFVQGDDYSIVCDEIEKIENHFPASKVKAAISDYLSDYFI